MNKIEGIKLKKLQTLAIFVLVLVNGFVFYQIMNKVYLRLDFTEGRKYSISRPTIELVQKLENKMIINYYYERRTKEVPGLSQVIQFVDDMLQEYANGSRGLIDYKLNELSFENPNDREKIDEIEKLGVRTVTLSQRDGSEARNTLGFSGVVIEYMGNTSTIQSVFTDARFEYNLNLEIIKMIGSSSKDKVGLLVATTDKTLEKDYRYLYQFMSSEYDNLEVIYDAADISEDLTTIVIVGGEALDEFQTYKIDQFVMSGGNLVVAANGVKLNFNNQFGGPQAFPSPNPVIDMLSSYGITINKDLVGDNLSYNPVSQRGQLFVDKLRYPLWVKVVRENINRENVIVDDFSSLNFFWPSSITVSEEIKDNTQVLFTTTADSWSMTDDFRVDLDSYKYPLQMGTGKFNLGVSFEGNVASHFLNKTIPEKDGADKKPFISNGRSKIVVFSNEDFLSNDFISREEELFLALNALDWLTQDGALIAIRNKGKFSRPLNKVLNQTMFNVYKNMIIGFTTYVIPLLFIIIGIIVSIMKKKRYKLIETKFCNPESRKDGESDEK